MTTRALIPLVAPCITQHDRDYMQERIAGGLLEDESEVTLFEEAFAEYVGCAKAIAVCSGTAALQIAYQTIFTTPFTIPSFTCVAVRDAKGSGVGYVDSSFDVATQRLTVDDHVAVLPHAFGTTSLSFGVPPIEDWTLSLGAFVGLVGQIGVCSTHESKMISTGRGGVIFGDTLKYTRRGLAGDSRYAMSATQAALGVSQLEQLDAFIIRRREVARYYTNKFQGRGFETPDLDCGSVFFRYIAAVDDPFSAVATLAERGVEAGHGVNPLLHRLAGLPDDDFPGACRDAARLLSVPVHPSLTDAEVEYVADQVVAVCAR